VVAGATRARTVERLPEYGVAFTDWLACACAGAGERAALAARAAGGDLPATVAFAATAGHVLDYDDTFADGVAHVSAACAPAALVVAADLGLTLGDALDAYAEGFQAMAAIAEASHPALYERGWHPTAVCGPIGAAVAASRLLGLPVEQERHALALAVLRAGATRGAFGSDGKSIQVGLASAAGVQATLLARAGATIGERAIHGPVGFEAVVGATWSLDGAGTGTPAILRNWIKLRPSCLGTHSPIDAAASARSRGVGVGAEPVEVLVHPRGRQAAHLDAVADGLSAKFSIPYCVAHTLMHGPPGVRDFAAVDAAVASRARLVRVTLDEALPEFGAILRVGGEEVSRVDWPQGSPERPVSDSELQLKLADLAGDRLDGLLDDLDRPASAALEAAGLG
jgi:2-methylcitrate dehydratase PrpD